VIKFPKIETLFKRGDDFKLLDPLQFKNPAHEIIARWVVTEKIDGMNMRVGMTVHPEGMQPNAVQIAGRSDKAQIPGDLIEWITQKVQPGLFRSLFQENTPPGTEMVLFGEGYGSGIQKGGYYSDEKKFTLFDVALRFPDDEKVVWLPDGAVTAFASKLDISRVPVLAVTADMPWIVQLVRNGFATVADDLTLDEGADRHGAEGIVARPIVPLFDARGQRIIIKLKTKDFTGAEVL